MLGVVGQQYAAHSAPAHRVVDKQHLDAGLAVPANLAGTPSISATWSSACGK